MRLTHYYIVLQAVVLMMCQSTKGTLVPETIVKVAEAQLGSPCEFFYNTTKTHILSYSAQSNQVAGRTKFLVMKVVDGSVIESGDFRPGYIRWVDEDTIEYLDAPEIVGLDDSLDNYKKTIRIN